MRWELVVVILLLCPLFSCGGDGNYTGWIYSGSPVGKTDVSFNDPLGYVLFDGPSGNTDVGVETAIQPDGKIVVAGYSNNGSKNNILLLRYTKEGLPDQDFGNNGAVIHDGGGIDHKALGLALASDGSIIVAGYIRFAGGRDILVLKFGSDGVLEKTFVNSSEGQFTDIAFGVVVQPDGKIVVVGERANGGSQDVVLLRLTGDLELDPTFGAGGVVTYNGSGSGNDKGFAVALQGDGKIVVAGAQILNGSVKEDLLVLRYNSDGVLDPTFGENGVFSYSCAGDNSDYGNSVQIPADGKIMIAGASNDGDSFRILLLRLNSHGALDVDFGTGGTVIYESPSALYDYALGMTVQSDGKILVAGESGNGSNNDGIVLRFDTSGILDPFFAEGGVFTFNGISDDEDGANALALQPDGKIVVTGYSVANGNRDVLTLRLE